MRRSATRGLVSFAALLTLLLAGAALADQNASSGAVSITLPPDAKQFAPGPGQALANANCTECHAADYVYMQPPLTKTQWAAEVTKMKAAFGASIPDDAIGPLVDYLVQQNGKQYSANPLDASL
jgi:mono/diheme cytochrome c family protein